MPVLQQADLATPLAVGATQEPCTGWTYEYLPWPAAVKILAQWYAAGTTAPCKMSVWSGSEAIAEEVDIGKSTGIHLLPNDLNCHPITFNAPAGDRLKVRFTSKTTDTEPQFIIMVEPIR